MKNLNIFIFLALLKITILTGCCNFEKRSAQITFLKKQKEVNLSIFIHGTHMTKYINQFMRLPNNLTKLTDLNETVFYKTLMRCLVKSNPEEFPLESFYIYGWSGELNPNSRKEAAWKLYNILKNKVKNNKNIKYKITIIGHSHGGNIALNMANFFNEKCSPFKINKLILLGVPVQEENKHFSKSNFFNNVYNIYSSMDIMQRLDIQKFHPGSKGKKLPVFSCQKFEPNPNIKQAKIKINNRSLFHIEFILENFLNNLSCLIKQMDKLDWKKSNYLIKINNKNKSYEILDSGKKVHNEVNIDNGTNIDNTNKNNITIFIHGSHNGSSRLLIKYVDINYKLRPVSQLDPRKYHTYLMAKYFCKNICEFNSFYAFGWSGRVSNLERYKAAQILYDELKQLSQKENLNPKITIITHSHGGNVALNLAKVVNEKNDNMLKIDKVILLACPVQEQTKYFIKSPVFEKIYHIYSSLDSFQVLDPQGLHKINKCKKVPFFSQRRFDDNEKLNQGKIKINNRALFHIEFILEDFLYVLPYIIIELNKKKINSKDIIKVNMKRIK